MVLRQKSEVGWLGAQVAVELNDEFLTSLAASTARRSAITPAAKLSSSGKYFCYENIKLMTKLI